MLFSVWLTEHFLSNALIREEKTLAKCDLLLTIMSFKSEITPWEERAENDTFLKGGYKGRESERNHEGRNKTNAQPAELTDKLEGSGWCDKRHWAHTFAYIHPFQAPQFIFLLRHTRQKRVTLKL